MRGASLEFTKIEDSLRITPAHAGSIFSFPGSMRNVTDHPRACGEHFPLFHGAPPFPGSPPRMRGA